MRAITLVTMTALYFLASVTWTAAGILEDAAAAMKRSDYATAFKILKPAAEKGDSRAAAELGAMYLVGRGIQPDAKQAVHWTKFAAEKGVASAQYNLGSMYLDGDVVSKDYKEAMKWFLAAARNGVPAAQIGVASMYAEGNGVAQDFKEAYKWMLLAAQQGDSDAQLNLGSMYALGKGVDRDLKHAYMWTFIATESPTVPVKDKKMLREVAAKVLAKEELAKAEQMIRDCKAVGLKQCK